MTIPDDAISERLPRVPVLTLNFSVEEEIGEEIEQVNDDK
jgi:hypothetical protein